MQIIVKEEDFAILNKITPKEDDRFQYAYQFRSKRGRYKVDIRDFSDDALKKLDKYLVGKGDASAKRSAKMVQQWMEIKQDPQGQKVTKLDSIPGVMGAWIGATSHKYIFEQGEDGNTVPWLVTRITYHPRENRRDYVRAAYVEVSLKAMNLPGEPGKVDSSSFSISENTWRDKTMSEILETEGYYLQTEERMASYKEELDTFLEYYSEDGFQMNVTGKAKQAGDDHYSHGSYRGVDKAGVPARMVIDTETEEWEPSSTSCSFWNKTDDDDYEDVDENTVMYQIPVHPIAHMFDLNEHCNYYVHINNAEPYEYDPDVGDKLVLAKDVKGFIEVLIEHSKNSFTDIISGKEGGTVILLEGPPGVGKTLSAEVYSEMMQRPLYKVQSSQLGTSADALETELKEVLGRSERWGAILLIDEADVYIHHRGNNVEQNAIVGVFLRVLEYYRGVLFMTTNRGTVVDDAIISRLTARMQYKKPTEDEQKQLWKLLAAQNNIEFSAKELPKIMKALPDISGRDIKNLLKLAYVLSLKQKKKITVDTLVFVAQFRQMQKEEE